MADSDNRLDDLFQQYRAACPELEASANFMPALWQKIEGRRGFTFAFEYIARPVMTVLAALCLLLLVLNFAGTGQNALTAPTYADALAADNTAERTDYAEALRNTANDVPTPPQLNEQPIR